MSGACLQQPLALPNFGSGLVLSQNQSRTAADHHLLAQRLNHKLRQLAIHLHENAVSELKNAARKITEKHSILHICSNSIIQTIKTTQHHIDQFYY